MAQRISRRDALRTAGVGLGVLGAGQLLASCSTGLKGASGGGSSTTTLKIGYVSPQTGPLASFATGDNYIINKLKPLLNKGFNAGGKTWNIEVVVKDSQSTTTRATQVTQDLINSDKVDIVVASATPDTANPVSDACEASGIPNVTTIVPWEAWFFGRGKKPGDQFKYSTMFFFGLKEFTDLFTNMWQNVGDDSGAVACLWPNDTDANAFRAGFPPPMKAAGYKAVDSGAYADGTTDFSAQIAKFKAAHTELFTCCPIPPDFQTFWKQAAQQGYKPKLATVAKVMLFPSEAVALGNLSNNIATDVWWSPRHPTSRRSTARPPSSWPTTSPRPPATQWTQALGSAYSLFEIAVQALRTRQRPQGPQGGRATS